MASENSQDGRITQVTTSLGKVKLVLLDFSGVEHVNGINVFNVRARSKAPIDLNEVMGTPMQIDMDTGDTQRSFHQIVVGARTGTVDKDSYDYEFELKPWIWLLNYRVTSRIFSKMTTIDIIRKLVTAIGHGSDLQVSTSLGVTEREYTVQYNESDLTFLRRLMEEEGINFHVTMAAGSHKLVLTDDTSSFGMAEGGDIKFNPLERGLMGKGYAVDSISDERQITPGALRTSDYNFLTPNTGLEVSHTETRKYSNADFEVYTYPGDYLDPGKGKELAQRRAKALRTGDALKTVRGYAPAVGAGMRCKIGGGPVTSHDGTYAVLRARHQFASNSYRSGGGGAGLPRGYKGEFLLTAQGNPVAPHRTSPRPTMVGPQTAVVTGGPKDSEDPNNRIWVKFFWDTQAESLPVRVAQLWAGNGWGTNFIPREGMEVVVEFLHGNIDYPIITGCVYNSANPPPWQFPGKHTVSGIKTTSMGAGGFNELSFDDDGGNEKFVIHAQKDYNSTIENDSLKKVGNNMKTEVKANRDVIVTEASTLKAKTIKLEGQQKIELVCGTSKITMTPDKIVVTSTNVEVTATAQLKTSGLVAEHGASVDLAIKAALVRIN